MHLGRKPASSRHTLSLGGASGGNPLDGIFSFVKEGKARLVKSIAGDYDAAAVREKIDKLIADNRVLMLSFTT
jgi:hypothetical protein